MRLLYLPNEPEVNGAPFRQGTGRVGFAALLEKGRLTALDTYSYYQRLKELGAPEAFTAEFLQRIAGFQPDIIFVQHVPKIGIEPDLWRQVRKAAPSAALICHEADVYGRIMKRFHEPLLALAAEADLTILCALGYVHDALKSRSRALAYLPHCYDGETFGLR
jgi:hypothetical protein